MKYIYLLNVIYKITKVTASRLCQGCYENTTSKFQTLVSSANTNVYFCQAYSCNRIEQIILVLENTQTMVQVLL